MHFSRRAWRRACKQLGGSSKLVWISASRRHGRSRRQPPSLLVVLRVSLARDTLCSAANMLEKPVLQDQKDTNYKLKNNPEEEDQDLDVTNEARIYLSRASLYGESATWIIKLSRAKEPKLPRPPVGVYIQTTRLRVRKRARRRDVVDAPVATRQAVLAVSQSPRVEPEEACHILGRRCAF